MSLEPSPKSSYAEQLALSEKCAMAAARFDEERLDYSPQTGAMFALYEVFLAARSRSDSSVRGGAMFVAPFGTGKTVTLERLRDFANKDAEPGTHPVLLIETSTIGTVDSVPTSILQALRVPRADAGNEKLRWGRALEELRKAKVSLAVFDEFNRASRRPTMSGPIATIIRERLMDGGVCAVAFVGSEDAGTVLAKVPELVQRLDDSIDLAPLDWLIDEDREILTDFLNDLDNALEKPELLGGRSNLSEPDTAEKLCEASNGCIRSVMKIVRGAMLSALRRGCKTIENGDLYDATDIHAIKGKLIQLNPFA